ncbi:interleukin-4 receptor subunit alpha-like isoform X2 [Sinocyclocheilus grahami]|nr:PREDICTED: interleukin-4 receptor subunit alpha-like isoform X2 [Sinocyclocheilus grahami]
MFSTALLSQIILALFCQAFCFEPTEEDLKCFNDYETEMKCSLSTDRLKSCSGYKLNITHTVFNMFQKMYACIFERSNHSDNCECKIKVQDFLLNENFTSTLLEGTNVLSSKTFKTEDFIKPKTPVLSVQKTANGNFNVTWDDQYEIRVLEDLRINLTYGIKGGHENISKTVPNTVGSFEIMGKNLQPNTNYILTATMSTDYNDHSISSDQSAPVEFTTSSSPDEIAKMVIPPLCVGLIIIICVIFICILRMKMNWWDKISKPKIDANLGEEKGHILPPSVMKFSPIHVEITTLDLHEDKKLYQGFSVLEKGNDADVCVNLSDDVGADEKCIMKKLITCTNPLYPLKFPQSTGQDPTSVQQSSWATSLHFPPVIQIDSSYQCV